MAASGWSSIEARPVDIACSLPLAELPIYVTRMGPYGRARSTLDETARTAADAAVLSAFDPFVAGDQVRFTSAFWRVTAVACPGVNGRDPQETERGARGSVVVNGS
jgi:hypothetical protein